MIAVRKAPQIHRKKGEFHFEWLADFDRTLWRAAQEGIRHLDGNAGAVAGQRVGADRATVREVAQNLQALLDNRMTRPALGMGNKADAAGVMLLLGGIEALALWQSRMTHA